MGASEKGLGWEDWQGAATEVSPDPVSAAAPHAEGAASCPDSPHEVPQKFEEPDDLVAERDSASDSPLSLLRSGLRAALGALALPEEEELQRRRHLCQRLEEKLNETESLYQQLQEELRTVHRRYLKIIGSRLVELDEVEACLAEAIATRRPKDVRARSAARRARQKARRSRAALETTARLPEASVPVPKPAALKKLYRDVARRLHPDFSVDEQDRQLREWYMAEANRAYQRGDEMRLRSLVDDYQCSAENVTAEGTAGELVRVIRRSTWLKRRLGRLDCAIRLMLRSDLYRLRMQIERYHREGRDFLLETASRLDKQIAELRQRLARLQEDHTDR